ncbi:MAG: hypothetical protein O3C27_16500 [Actinomycetota bacterium]|nr:hypothetical protein [Actinomycetota bacterium]
MILVPLVMGVQAVQARGGSQLDASGDRIGTPTESWTPNTPTTGVVVAPSSTTASTAPGTVVSLASFVGSSSMQASKWTSTVVITLLDQNNQPIAGATISGTWTAEGNNQTTTCTTDTNGNCTVTQWNLKMSGLGAHADNTYTLDSITGTNLTVGPSVTGTSITVLRPA